MFNSRTLLVGTLVGGNTLEKYISKSVKNNMIGKEISTKKCTFIFIFGQNNKKFNNRTLLVKMLVGRRNTLEKYISKSIKNNMITDNEKRNFNKKCTFIFIFI
jgi:hypothetical protein